MTSSRLLPERSRCLAGLALLALILFLSFLPSEIKVRLHTRGPFHAWGHVYLFAGACVLLADVVRSSAWRWAAMVGLLAFGCGIEGAQARWHISDLEVTDVVCDAVGIGTGALIGSLRRRSDLVLRPYSG